ncbi:methylcytosine dioxygenase TET3 isoform X1 [Hyla sarda]|uniref:methylcytosine dioxygenase TET3 isoform X1 n=2 Tax=Hyla sarda TaxID=327740 RepID=UPI0024C3432F|nr:methylcytosine dioxygenase TET3 isoform X1 [Hyla sarda]XP_056427476.1 methylcytosine dioxygenase TET3 isoform X1 [Hyla sarda]
MMETEHAPLPRMGAQDVYDFCDDGESLGRLKPVELPVEMAVGGPVGGDSNMELAEQPLKKRKRCGVCVPCLRKEPCGACTNCVNRSTSHQICKMRKCEQLKKKRVVPLKVAEVVNKDSSQILPNGQLVTNCSEDFLVDGPKTDQMETGPVNPVEEGRVTQACDQVLLNKGCEDLGNRLLMEANPWLSNPPIPQDSGKKINWDNAHIHNHAAANNSNLEDAKNLVAFSAVAEAMSYGLQASGPPSMVSTQLYEKFHYEMNREGSSLPENKPPSCPEDINTLKTALELAKHGMKPPNCNCDGPECPDYLEWLENKIKSVKDRQDGSHNPLNQVSRELVEKNYSKEHVLALENKIAKCPSGPLPFSQNAWSIAKEKNISLQTAIAIEALTQLSSALPQTNKDCPNGPSQTPLPSHERLTHFSPAKVDQGQLLPMSCNEMFQNQQSQIYTGGNALPMSQPSRQTSWDQNKAPSYHEGQYIPEKLSHGTPMLQNEVSTPQKSEFMQQWAQGPEQPRTPSDPMSGLKQLLGNADDYIKSVFKGPESITPKVKKSKQGSVKKETPTSDFYKMSPDQQLSQLFQESEFHRSTQAALQQHLHHKRNLFVDSQAAQQGSQEQQNWWVPNSPKAAKTADKPVKERKKRGQSPSQKQAEPKIKVPRKQVQIKKPKQKEGQALFLPMSQIKIEEFHPPLHEDSQPSEKVDQSLPNDKSMVLTSQPGSQASVDNRFTLNTQETCSVNQSNDRQGRSLSLGIHQTNRFGPKSTNTSSSIDDTSSSSAQSDSVSQQANTGHVSVQNDLIDDKFEDLIRQFEAEFGDDFPLPSTEMASQNGASPAKPAMPIEPQARHLLPPQPPPVKNSTMSVSQEMSQNFESLFSSKSPRQVKIESSGAITVVSTTCFSEENKQLDGTPTKSELPFNPSLSGFLESPLSYLTSPTKSLLDTPAKRAQAEFPTCDCVEQINEKDEGPYYTHLGSGPTVESIRELMEERYGEKGKAIRIEKVIYTGREGKSSRGCPIAKWVIRRQSEEEKLLCLVRRRAGHHCENAVIIILIMAWEGIPRSFGDKLYDTISETITKYGNPTSRRCGLNDDRTCACQGKDPNTCGASFSFGCSWSMYFNGCKYARSKTPRKFRLIGDNPKEEDCLKDNFQDLATRVAPVYKMLAPQAYENQVNNEEVAIDCRLGLEEGRPFSGVTACMDFCAHAHKDQHNLYNGCTVVCTLTKEDNRMVGKIAEDEQLHVLPLYKVSNTDEFGSEEGQQEKMRKGGLQVLSSFPREVRKLSEPAKSCRQRQLEAKRLAAEKKKLLKEKLTTPDKTKLEPAEMPTDQQNQGAQPQQVKPCIKVEPTNHYNTYKYNANGVVESYSVLGSCRPSDPYSMNSVYSYHSFYAQAPNLPSINGYHTKFALPPFGYYGLSNNPVVPSQFMNYGSNDTRTGGWMSNAFDKKSEMQPAAESLNHGYGNESSEQNYGRSGDIMQQYNLHDANRQKSASTPHRTTPAPMDNTPYSSCFNKVIKKEPMNEFLHDAFQRSPSVHSLSQSPALNLSLPKNDQAIPYKANGALSSSERPNSSGPQNMVMNTDKTSLTNGLDKRDYYGVQSNGMGLKNIHGPNKQWGIYGMDTQTGQRDSNTPGKVWSSCKLSENSANAQENWNSGRAMKETQMFQEKLWNSVAGNDRCSVTPSASMQDRSWNMFASPATPSTPLKADTWDPFSLDDNMNETPVKKEEEEDEEVWSDSEHNFLDENIGGVAVAPAHGSILIECARRELHATTPLKKPNRCHPTRISLVFYQHKNLNQPNHGLALWEAKMKQLAERARLRQEEAARLGIKQEVKGKKRKWGGAATTETPPVEKKDSIPTRQAAPMLTNSFTTSSSYAYTKVTGPYSRWI